MVALVYQPPDADKHPLCHLFESTSLIESTAGDFNRFITKDMRTSNINALGWYCSNVHWSIIKDQNSSENKLSRLDKLVKIEMKK